MKTSGGNRAVNLYVGIDPGASGGIAVIKQDGGKSTVTTMPIPATDVDIWEWAVCLSVCGGTGSLPQEDTTGAALKTSGGNHAVLVHAVIEKVGGYIGGGKGSVCPYCHQERNRSPGSGMFKFGVGYGGLRMALTAAAISFDEVAPVTWQKVMGIPNRNSKTESKADHKRKLKERAQQLFPKIKVTLGVADALLLAEYCRRLKS